MNTAPMMPRLRPRPAGLPQPERPAAPPVVEVRGVNFHYHHRQVLFDLELEVFEHEILALIGPSGCGKSTFLRSLNRMNDLIPGARLSGQVRIQGENVYAPGADVIALRRRVGMVFQRSNPFPFSIEENVAYGLRTNNLARGARQRAEVVERSLRAAGLWEEVKDRLRSPALALSGGQQQRLCIARALAIEPQILLMDEPASALDPIATARIEELALELKQHYTLVIVTHNLQQAARISDRTSFFLSGRIIETGNTQQLFTQPAKQETEDYITGRFG
ncbi:MAG TPA: phosphate ABC transporter ATP-binding protein PstB [Terriglobales bacterium]|nr:phosphate ABC transporter ATP-binding protein PstB [Terriglobales bacterium]